MGFLDQQFFLVLWMPFCWWTSESRFSIGYKYCRNSSIISEYQDNKNPKNLSIVHTDTLSLLEILMKPKTWLKAQLLFLMHFCSNWYRVFLPLCWRESCSMPSVMHYQHCMDQWWRERKFSLSLCWFSRTTLNSCLWVYLCICTELSQNKCNSHCSNSFSSSFPCRFVSSIWLSTGTTCSLFSSAAGHFTIYSQSIAFCKGTATWFRSTAESPSRHSFSLGLYHVITACSCISLKARKVVLLKAASCKWFIALVPLLNRIAQTAFTLPWLHGPPWGTHVCEKLSISDGKVLQLCYQGIKNAQTRDKFHFCNCPTI